MKNWIILIFLSATLYACSNLAQGTQSSQNDNPKVIFNMANKIFDNMPKNQKKMIENYFKFMHNPTIDEGKDFFYLDEYATSEDCDAIVEIIAQQFTKYNPPIKSQVFNGKLYEIFGYKRSEVNNFTKKTRSNNCIELEINDGNNNFWICLKECIIIPSKYISLEFKDYNNINTLELSLYKDLLYYNQYIFNNNQAGLTWLINNDKDFVKALLYSFGYDKESRINKLILDEIDNTEGTSRFNNLFAKKYSANKLQIRKNLMEYVYNHTTMEDAKYLQLLDEYGNYIMSAHSDDYNSIYTKEDKLKIASYVFYYSAKTNYDKGTCLRGFAKRQIDKELNGEGIGLSEFIEKNNYFGLPDFEELINRLLEDNETESAHRYEE